MYRNRDRNIKSITLKSIYIDFINKVYINLMKIVVVRSTLLHIVI